MLQKKQAIRVAGNNERAGILFPDFDCRLPHSNHVCVREFAVWLCILIQMISNKVQLGVGKEEERENAEQTLSDWKKRGERRRRSRTMRFVAPCVTDVFFLPPFFFLTRRHQEQIHTVCVSSCKEEKVNKDQIFLISKTLSALFSPYDRLPISWSDWDPLLLLLS